MEIVGLLLRSPRASAAPRERMSGRSSDHAEVRRPGSPITAAALYRAVLLVAALVVAGLLFGQLVTLVLLTVMTVLVALPLTAATTRLERRGVPRGVGAPLTMLALLAGLAAIVALLVPAFVSEVNQFVDALPRIVERLLSQLREATGAQRGELARRAHDLA